MKAIRFLSLAAAMLMLSVPQSAQARFGKRSSDSKRSESSSSSRRESTKEHKAVRADAPSAPARRSEGHRPVIVSPGRSSHYHARPHSHPRVYAHSYSHAPHYGYVAVAPPAYVPVAAAPAAQAEAVVSPDLFVGVSAQGHAEGATLGLGVGIEGKRWGLNGSASGILAKSIDSVSVDAIQLLDMRLSYALIAKERFRVRVEGGVSGAIAPDLAVVGPDFGASASLGLLGPIGFAASAYVTPIPFGKIDAKAAVTLTLDALQFQAGVRSMRLDDYGMLGDRNVDDYSGPFVGLALVL